MKRILFWFLPLLLSACASYDGHGLLAGRDSVDDVVLLMGKPAMEWKNADGTRQLSYPRGPAGAHSYMVQIDAQGKLASVDNVLNEESFARIQPGMKSAEVVRFLGPTEPGTGTTYFAARNELVWEWRYCDAWSVLERFYVLFDASSKTVRSTMSHLDPTCGGIDGHCGCSR